MWVKFGIAAFPPHKKVPTACGLTIGAFDGVHLGHQALIRQMVTQSHRHGWAAVVLTFDPLPRQFLKRGEIGVLSSLAERLIYLEPLGVDGVVVLPFNADFTSIPATPFIDHLVNQLGMRGLWAGSDFVLGHNREGNVNFLRELGKQRGFSMHIFEETVQWHGDPVHSSHIRKALKEGRLEQVNGYLGRPYHISGIVGHGDQRGRTLGYPTANLEIEQARLLPAKGVYVCHAHLERGHFNAVTNVGTRPTFNNRPPTVEAYLLDFDADIYDEPMQLDFLLRLRPELKFPSATELIRQMQRDVSQTRAWLETNARAEDLWG